MFCAWRRRYGKKRCRLCKDYTIVLCHDGRYDRENFIILIEKSERDAKDILKVHVRRPVEG